MTSFSSIDLTRVPTHVAIIMDGNGRWAQQQDQPRTFGHRQGVEAVRRTVKAANAIGIQYLTVFGFSTENWSRPSQEVGFLMGLLRAFFGARLAELVAGNVRVRVLGDVQAFDQDVQELLAKAENDSAENTGLQLLVALNYGGRAEIIRATKRALANGATPDTLDEQAISAHLDAADVPDPDLVIRTSGEHRVSNFLLWQLAYSELYFCDALWPEFDDEHLYAAIADYQSRDRRFGGLNHTHTKGLS